MLPLAAVTGISSGLTLIIPRLIANGIDAYRAGSFAPQPFILSMAGVILAVALLSTLQSYISIYTSELFARDIRRSLTDAIAKQSFHYVSKVTPSTLQTNFTSDVDAVKAVISQGIIAILSAVVTLVGALSLMFLISVKLTLIALAIVPIIGILFSFVIGRVGKLFRRSQENLEQTNRTINESIIASSLVRVLNSQAFENSKFGEVNAKARELGMSINRNISSLIPFVQLLSNLITVAILWYGGNLVASSNLTVGNFSAFLSYTNLLIFPIILLAFVSNQLTRSFISYGRILKVLHARTDEPTGSHKVKLKGDISFQNVSLEYGTTPVLKDISFNITSGTKTAIVGPTAAGKTQLFYLLTGLVAPTSGSVLIDGTPVAEYDQANLRSQIGLVFQDSVIFNGTLRENIDLGQDITAEDLNRAIETADLVDLITSLPEGLNTLISERGSNMSGGQKQRLMLARALVRNPPILLLDDFTARVDRTTEQTILANVERNYRGTTLVIITQKIAPVESYEEIILVMEGELLGLGLHSDLMKTSLEYRDIYASQRTSESL